MAITNPDILKAGDAAEILFQYLDKETKIPDQITGIEDDINNFDATGYVSVNELLAIGKIGTTGIQELQDNQTNLNVTIDLAKNTIKNYFEDYPTAEGITNKEGTKAIEYDSGTDTVSIVTYP